MNSVGNPLIFHLCVILTSSCLPYSGLSSQRCSKQTSKNPSYSSVSSFFSLCCVSHQKKNTIRSVWGGLVMLTSESLSRTHTSIIKTTWDYFREVCELPGWRIYCIWKNWCLSAVFLKNGTNNLPGFQDWSLSVWMIYLNSALACIKKIWPSFTSTLTRPYPTFFYPALRGSFSWINTGRNSKQRSHMASRLQMDCYLHNAFLPKTHTLSRLFIELLPEVAASNINSQ